VFQKFNFNPNWMTRESPALVIVERRVAQGAVRIGRRVRQVENF